MMGVSATAANPTERDGGEEAEKTSLRGSRRGGGGGGGTRAARWEGGGRKEGGKETERGGKD